MITDHSFDHCPTCNRSISDIDAFGCEAENGQRYCLPHLKREVDPELFDSFKEYWDSLSEDEKSIWKEHYPELP